MYAEVCSGAAGGSGAGAGGSGDHTGGAGATNVAGGGVGAAGGAAPDGMPVNLPMPGKRSPTVRGFGPETPSAGGAGATGGGGGAAVSQSGGFTGSVAVPGAGTRPSASRRRSTSSVIWLGGRDPYVG